MLFCTIHWFEDGEAKFRHQPNQYYCVSDWEIGIETNPFSSNIISYSSFSNIGLVVAFDLIDNKSSIYYT